MEFLANPFTRKATDYTRDINIEESYINQCTLFLQKNTGEVYQKCKDFVLRKVYGENTTLTDPLFYMLERDENLDQKPMTVPFSKYLSDLISNEWIMAPTFTCVIPQHQKVSMLSEYIKGNLTNRKKEKDLMFEAERKGDEVKVTLHNNNQNNAKILNNAISGNHRSEHSPLYDKASHPILTASCRIANGSANSNDDRLLSGMRHYYTPAVLLGNITSILELSDFDIIQKAVEKYNIHCPTPDELMDILEYSTSIYWRGIRDKRWLWDLINSCTPFERAAIAYTGDLYHLRKYNDTLIRNFIGGLVTRPSKEEWVSNPKEWMKHVDEDTIAQVKILFPSILGENDIWDDPVAEHPEFPALGTQCALIYRHLDFFGELITAFLMSKNIPFLISDFPHAIRRAGVGSDTDSAIFTVQDWIQWYSGNDDINYDNIVVAEAVAFLVSETTTHNLASMTVNMGVKDPKEIFRLSMKNEYLFPVFVLTNRAKHYFANQAVKEGVLFKKYKREKKGVELVASNSPAGVRKDLDLMIDHILKSVTESKPLDLHMYLRWVARWEYTIYDSIVKGETTYLKAARVKEEDGYTKRTEDANTPFINYELWQEVFGPRFGMIEPPPYSALSFSIVHDTKKKTEKWLSSWKDKEMAGRFERWLIKNRKAYVGRILLPESIIMDTGIPEDILLATNIRKIIGAAVSPFYLVLETMDYYLFDKDQNKLVFDMVSKEEAFMDFEEVESALRPEEPVEFLED